MYDKIFAEEFFTNWRKEMKLRKSLIILSVIALTITSFGISAYADDAENPEVGIECTHDYQLLTNEPATCSEDGFEIYHCALCEDEYTEIIPAVNEASIKLSASAYVYSGSAKKPSVSVKDTEGKALIKGIDYTVAYATGCTNVGKYKVTVKGKGNYGFTKTLYFKINPKATSISNLIADYGAFKVKWYKRTAQTSGYCIRYSTKSDMSKAKTLTVSGSSNTSKVIDSRYSKTKFYVQIRTYKTAGGVKYYSEWSDKKSVTTKELWIPVTSDYAASCAFTLNGYRFEYNNPPNPDGSFSSNYYFYRHGVEEGKNYKKLCKVKNNDLLPDAFTNGEKIIYNCFTEEGSIVYIMNMDGSSKKKLADMTKYKTWKSIDRIYKMFVYKGNLYYSKYRGLDEMQYKIYKVNIATGNETVVARAYRLGEPCRYMDCKSQYFPAIRSNGDVYIYNIANKSSKKIGGKSTDAYAIDGEYLYSVSHTKDGSSYKYTVKKRKQNGAAIKTVATFKTKLVPDTILDVSSKHVVFFNPEVFWGDYKEYVFSKKKMRTNGEALNSY